MRRRSAANSARPARRFAALGGVALVLASTIIGLAPASAGAAVKPGDVTMTVTDVTPNSPELSYTPQPMAFSLSLVNNTDKPLTDVTISAARSNDPITSQAKLDAAIAHPKVPSSDLVTTLKTTLTTTLTPRIPAALLFATTTDIPTDAEICLCSNAIYPIYFTAEYTPPGGSPVRIASTQTYLPSFTGKPTKPAKSQISWVWPLLDRPHRLYQTRVFRDDDLATEIAPGGRLDQLLEVVEHVGASVPMTLVTDPELIDELYVMQTGYRVRIGTTIVAGTGATDAAAWLGRLRAVLADGKMELTFSAPADPAVESLHQAGVTWSATTVDKAALRRISTALGGEVPPSDIAWPAGSTLTRSTLSTLVGTGTKIVIVSDTTLPKGSGQSVIPDALAPLTTSSGQAIAAVTSTPIERWVARVLTPGGPGLAALPQLVAELAIRAVKSLTQSHYVVITPPRELTVDPAVAERMILATAQTPWSSPLPLRLAVGSITPVGHGVLHGRVEPPRLAPAAVANLQFVAHALPGLRSLYADTPTATAATEAWAAALGDVDAAAQRCASSELLTEPALSIQCSQSVANKVAGVRNAVYVARPSGGGQYTLASKNSRLPITIVNHLPAAVRVRVSVRTVNGVPGFSAPDVERTIDANSTVQLRVPTHVNRVGRIDVEATLSTPDGISLGGTVRLTVHSTALGTIGVIITIVAALVLLIALLVRLIRRLRRGRHPAPTKAEPTPVATESS